VQYVLTGGTSVEIKTEADSFSMTECSHDAEPSTGVYGCYYYFQCFCFLGPLVVHCWIALVWIVFWLSC